MKAMMMGLMCAGVMMLAGCDTTKAPGAAGPDPLPATAYPKVAALEGLGDYLYSGKPVVDHGDGDAPLEVTVPLRLASDKAVRAQYRFIFFDEKGEPLRPRMNWRYQGLQPRAETFVSASATDPAAVDWRLEVRPAH